jgi:hypothetical protein
MNLPDEPKGWRSLQAMAQEARDSHSLALIINEMNRLLSQHERAAGTEPTCAFRQED